MALESTQLFHRQSNVSQRLCLTVDSSPLAENVLHSNQATVSPTFSIADILASSFPESTTECRLHNTNQSPQGTTALSPSSDKGESAVHGSSSGISTPVPEEEVTKPPKRPTPLIDEETEQKCDQWLGDINQPTAAARSSHLHNTVTSFDTVHSEGNVYERVEPSMDVEPKFTELKPTDVSTTHPTSPRTSNGRNRSDGSPCSLTSSASKRFSCLTRSPVFRIDVVADRQQVSTGTDTDLVNEEKTSNQLTMDAEIILPPTLDPLHDKVDDLLDAARCVRAEAQLQEAESVVDALIAKFAEPLDLYTAWENLHRPNPTPILYNHEEQTENSSQKEPKIPSFSPILPCLLSLPESNIFPQLCQPSSTGRKLLELCKQLAGDIRRTKRKLRILHKARARRSSNSGSARANISTHKSPTCPNTATVNERRTSYLRRLHEIWPGHESTVSSLDPCPSPSAVTKRSNTVPCVYTSPMECPLSLLSFVSDKVHTIHSQLASHNRTPNSPTVLTKPPTSVASSSTTTESKSLHTTDNVGNCARELTVQVHSVGPEQRSPATLSCCPSLSDTQPSFPGVESPSLPTFSLLSPSLSPSSSSTISAGGVGVMGSMLSYPGSRATGTKSKTSSRYRKPKPKDLVSCSSSSSSSRSSSGHQKRPRRVDRQTITGKKQSTQQASRRREPNTNPSTSLRSPTPISNRTTTGTSSRTADSDTDSRRRDRAPKLQLPRPISSRVNRTPNTWEQLRVVVRNSDETETAPDLTSAVSPDRPALTAPCSAPCVSFFQSESLNVAEHSVTPTKRTLSQQQQSGEFSDTGLIASSCDSDWLTQDDRSSNGIPNRPPTPDIRRSDLDLADLSNGTRVLVIQDTHLRAGTLYLSPSGSTTSPDPITLPTSSLRDHLFRIQLDAERPTHPGSPRFTSLPSPSRMASAPPRRTSSPAWATSTAGLGSLSTSGISGTAGTPKKRRQSDLVLYGWQVVQQAVLEVFPASVRHVPPGTRVCAAWSEQLAADLYPGTVIQAEPKEQIQPNCVPVGFDDGDRRQVPIANIRILPDHFTNLYELASAAHNQGGLGPSDLLPSATGLSMEVDQSLNVVRSTRTTGRVRHHSAMDRPSALVASGLTELVRSKRMGRTTQRVHTASAAVHVNKKPEPRDALPNQIKEESVTGINGCSGPSSKCFMESSVSSKSEQPSSSEPLTTPTTSATSQKRRHSTIVDPVLSTPGEERADDLHETATITESTRIHAPRPTTKISLTASSESGVEVSPERQNSPLLDNEVLSDTLSTTSSDSEQQQPVWHILDKVRRRKHRGISCRSIVRQTDGLIISVGDSVEFSSGHDEVYLGEVRSIRWEEVMNAPVVIAAWYYNLNEAGSDGELIKQLKGAVFATEHHDENEARCIVRRVQVAPSYAAYQAMIQASDHEPIPMDNVPKPTIKVDPESNQQTPLNSQTNRVESPDAGRLSTKPSSLFQDPAPQEQTTISGNNHGDNRGSSTPSSSSDESEEDVYFVAGKYDPVHRRVVAWDPDVARIIKSS